MCGICGIIYPKGKPVQEDTIKQMCEVMTHRGPDDEGWVVKDNVGLGVRRLSIIDLSTGHQPISNEDKSIWVALNGEIYNYVELRKELTKKGHRFTSASDTETIVHLYEEMGDECVDRLRGMFAFALWDANLDKLLLVRDRIGIKPLHYVINGEKLYFASEIKSLLQCGEVAREIEPQAIDDYLTYLYVPAPQTIYKNIKKLEPAYMLTYQKGDVKIRRYWDVNHRYENNENSEYEERQVQGWIQRVRELLTESVRMRLRSDVPLGAFLSGGLDSSTVVALMSSLMDEPVKTFSVGFKEGGFYDERRYAGIVAEQYGTEHREFILEPNTIELLPKIVWYLDEPLGNASVTANYLISELAKEHVTVALTGVGGDEVFAGYRRYYASRLAQYYQLLPRMVKEDIVPKVVDVLPVAGSSRLHQFFEQSKKFLHSIGISPEERYIRWNAYFDEPLKRQLYSADLKAYVDAGSCYEKARRFFDKVNTNDFVSKCMYVDLMTYLPGDPLVIADRMGMANSLELRVPLVDHKLVEYMATIPTELKLKGFTTKYILKKAMEGLLPGTIINRRKQGFEVPVGIWINNQLKEFVDEILLDSQTLNRGYFNGDFIRQLLKQQRSGKVDYRNHIWALLMLELWHRTFVDQYGLYYSKAGK